MKRSPAGREAEFSALFAAHAGIVQKVVHAYCRAPVDRDDLRQEIATALWRSFERFDDRVRFATWMYRVALNVAITFYRAERRRAAPLADTDPAAFDAADEGDRPDEALDALYGFIATLGDIDKALVLLYLDGYRYDEIAALTGLTHTNVATKLSRIKHRARIALSDPAATSGGTP